MTHTLPLALALACATAGAQTIGDLYAAMPEGVIPVMSRDNRLDCMDFFKSGMPSTVRNRLGGTCRITLMTDSLLRLSPTAVSEAELRLLPRSGGGAVIAMVYTCREPAQESDVDFFDTSWKPLKAAALITPPSKAELTPRGSKTARETMTRVTFTADGALEFALTDAGGAAPSARARYEWNGQRFARKAPPSGLPRNPLPMSFCDPFMLRASDGNYYMYGTSLSDGFEAYVSRDMETWEKCGQVYTGGKDGQWNTDCFWAPEVYEMKGKYYMFYSANWRHNPGGEEENFRIGVAVADSPAGPFRDLTGRPLFDPGYPIIDANVFYDSRSGKHFLYYSRCCYKHPVESEIADKAKKEGKFQKVEESWVYGVELKSDFSGVIGKPQALLCPPAKLSDRQAEWESRSVTSGEAGRRWTEGSFLFEDGGVYYMMYSANFFGGAHYAVGYATASSPLGPFRKADNNPVLEENVSRGGDVVGTGHCMALVMPDGTRRCVYHGRLRDASGKDGGRVVFTSPLAVARGRLTVDGPSTGQSAAKR